MPHPAARLVVAQSLFFDWQQQQRHPEHCRCTQEQIELIADRLELGYLPGDLICLFIYAFEADHPEPSWWRGDNPEGRVYLELSELLTLPKLAGRVQRALDWRLEQFDGSVEFGTAALLSPASPVPAKPHSKAKTNEQTPTLRAIDGGKV